MSSDKLPPKTHEAARLSVGESLGRWLREKRRHGRPRLGVSFHALSCYGSMSSTEYQKTFASCVLAIPGLFAPLLSRRRGGATKIRILDEVDGLVRPGEMLLVLGRPGSGCSTLLKTLAGDRYGFKMGNSAAINYQGIPFNEMKRAHKGECLYLAELDVHFPELTTEQTLTFAANTRRNEESTSEHVHQQSWDVASMFHLGSAFHTQVGNGTIRGLSGGEERRVSLAEALISDAQLQCWDNSTRGLDSSTASRFVRLMRSSSQVLDSTTIMSIYQASDEMCSHFDNVTLLYEGRQIYFGPVYEAAGYFQRMGFQRRPRSNLADFLTSITSSEERVIEPGFDNRVPKLPDDFAQAWRESTEREKLMLEIETFNAAYPVSPGCGDNASSDTSDKPWIRNNTYTLPITRQIGACIARGFLRLQNNYAPGLAGVIANFILSLVIGSIYFDLDDSTASLDKRAVLLFFSLMNSAFSPAFEVLTMWAQRPIVEKQSRYALYRPFTEAVASMICDLPLKVLVSFVFHLPLYFMSHLRRSIDAFFTYWLFMFTMMLTMSMLFRTVGSVSRTLEQTMAPNTTIVILAIIYTGFVVPQDYMVPWLGWFRWINPLFYAYESLMVNEFHDREFQCANLVPSGPGYTNTSMSDKICSVVGSVPGSMFVQGDHHLSLKYGFEQNHLWRNFPILFAMMIALCGVHLLAAEFIPAEKSRGEVLLYPRRFAVKQRQMTTAATPNDTLEEDGPAPRVFAQDLALPCLGPVPLKGQDRKSELAVTLLRHHGTFHWRDLDYQVKTKAGTRQILSQIEGWVKPGTLTALMGVTGAGKTSLLDVLADRVSQGQTSGNVFIDGKQRDAGFRRRIGYAQQRDLHPATATIREALIFSALLRQPSDVLKQDKLAHVDHVLDVLEMAPYAHAVIGKTGEGLNIEQRKRLTIAVEMAAKPELMLFLDEPTSGLDSQTAWSICNMLRNMADYGQTVLCTIHQPSAELFHMFDNLLLLGSGGKQLYFGPIGPDSRVLIDYFESQGAPKCSCDTNPAEWLIEITQDNPAQHRGKEDGGGGTGATWSECWKGSEQRREVRTRLDGLEHEAVAEAAQECSLAEDAYAASFPTQLWLVTKRIFQEQWRDPVYLYSKIALCIGISLANGLSFYESPLDIQGLNNTLFSVFLLSQFFSTLDQQIIPRFMDGRALYDSREQRDNSYSWVTFVASNLIVEIFWQSLASVVVFVVWYYPTGLWRNGSGAASPLGTVERGAMTTFSQLIAAGTDAAETAVQLATLCFWLSLVFCGILVFPDDLPGFWVFMYRASPLTYVMNGLVIAGVAGTRVSCSAGEMLRVALPSNGEMMTTTCGEYLGAYARSANGDVVNPGDFGRCLYCPIRDTDALLEGIGMDTRGGWRLIGFVSVYVAFNIVGTFGLYWAIRVRGKKSR